MGKNPLSMISTAGNSCTNTVPNPVEYYMYSIITELLKPSNTRLLYDIKKKT